MNRAESNSSNKITARKFYDAASIVVVATASAVRGIHRWLAWPLGLCRRTQAVAHSIFERTRALGVCLITTINSDFNQKKSFQALRKMQRQRRNEMISGA